jgi:hypothetical protein
MVGIRASPAAGSFVHGQRLGVPLLPDPVEREPDHRVRFIGAAGFEPATPCSQSRCATKLRHAPLH